MGGDGKDGEELSSHPEAGLLTHLYAQHAGEQCGLLFVLWSAAIFRREMNDDQEGDENRQSDKR